MKGYLTVVLECGLWPQILRSECDGHIEPVYAVVGVHCDLVSGGLEAMEGNCVLERRVVQCRPPTGHAHLQGHPAIHRECGAVQLVRVQSSKRLRHKH